MLVKVTEQKRSIRKKLFVDEMSMNKMTKKKLFGGKLTEILN